MSLAKYNQKRSFDETPEPKGGLAAGTALRFVIQKHDASHLHYDFRLEMEGVLKSWAVPKGPSINPTVKRLAMMVEDHPYDYRTFEGTIPEGNYGAGTVIVWDEGYYEPIEKITGKRAQEKELLKELKAGSLKINLHGKKLKGEFALVKTKGMADNAWLLIKHNDKYAGETDITTKDKSVISKKSIAQMAKQPDKIYTPKKTAGKAKKAAKTKEEETAGEEDNEADATAIAAQGKRKAFYTIASPMLATLVDKPFEEEGWIYEIKWDGYRAVAFMNKGKVVLKSRNNVSFEEKFGDVYDALQQWNVNAIVDGEIVVLNNKGIPDFEALQSWGKEEEGTLVYYVFDILWFEGKDLTALPLNERRAILKSIMPDDTVIQFSDDFKTSAKELLQQVKQKGLEGIMAKKADSLYKTDYRSKEWLKIKDNNRQEMVIGGFTKNADTSKPFSALLMGVFQNGKFIYTGKVGTGFSIKMQKELLEKMNALVTDKSPFEEREKTHGYNFYTKPHIATTTWLKPQLIAEVAFTEMTKDNVMRHPAFMGLREDKKAKEVKLEKAAHTKEVLHSKTKPVTKAADKQTKPVKSKTGKPFIETSDTESVIKTVNRHQLTFTNLNKIYWPKEKITKRDLINYYHDIASYILPYLKERPQSLNRYPNGITGESFYQKDVTGKVPEWMKTFGYQSEGDNKDKNFLLCNDEATLLYMASLGCIEIHPWSSTVKKPEYPTWCVIDLDPDKNSFDDVIEAAQVTHRILDDLKVDNYVKTSGSTGIHIYIPLGAKYTYDQSKEFARIIVTLVHKELPKFTSLERNVRSRKGKMYLDFLQNRNQATLAAPYSCRPKPGATVSMPLQWEEVKKGLKMTDFHIFNALERAQSMGDIFKPVLGKGIDMEKAISNALSL
ncbi:DNA ligase D [Taibaiella lutea]|uniref:DNA ligase (ATP) n=1 Tax=Taibaiella lutea TaxID=2608001 RepID=A0A5M6CC31_9BACT|nr:DNA ligase D [Taibaiella lutea]KAA5532611.1 DNA ligase D [Taibaiella lutea]